MRRMRHLSHKIELHGSPPSRRVTHRNSHILTIQRNLRNRKTTRKYVLLFQIIVVALPVHVWQPLELSSIYRDHDFWSSETTTGTPCPFLRWTTAARLEFEFKETDGFQWPQCNDTHVQLMLCVSARRRPVGFRERAVLHMRKRDLCVKVRCQRSCLLKIICIYFAKLRFFLCFFPHGIHFRRICCLE